MKTNSACTLVELLVATSITALVLAIAWPTFTTRFSVADGNDPWAAPALARTAESLIDALADCRVVLAPRVRRGARRGPLLIAVDSTGRLCGIAAEAGRLQLHTHDPSTGRHRYRSLGHCSAALFHYRGHSRRVLRLRLELDGALLATSLHLVNSLWPPQPPRRLSWPRTNSVYLDGGGARHMLARAFDPCHEKPRTKIEQRAEARRLDYWASRCAIARNGPAEQHTVIGARTMRFNIVEEPHLHTIISAGSCLQYRHMTIWTISAVGSERYTLTTPRSQTDTEQWLQKRWEGYQQRRVLLGRLEPQAFTNCVPPSLLEKALVRKHLTRAHEHLRRLLHSAPSSLGGRSLAGGGGSFPPGWSPG